MNRLNGWLCTFFAVLFSFTMLPHLAFAGEKTLEAAQAKIVSLERQIVAVNAEIAKADAQSATAKNMPASAAVLVSLATFTAHTPAEGWYAWKRQSREYHKMNPWEKILADNCARDSSICKRTARAGAVFYLPATDIRVLVPVGAVAPEAIMLAPTADPQVFTLAPSLPVMTKSEVNTKRMSEVVLGQLTELDAETTRLRFDRIALGAAALLFFLLYLTFSVLYNRADLAREELKKKNADLVHRLDLVGEMFALEPDGERPTKIPGQHEGGGLMC